MVEHHHPHHRATFVYPHSNGDHHHHQQQQQQQQQQKPTREIPSTHIGYKPTHYLKLLLLLLIITITIAILTSSLPLSCSFVADFQLTLHFTSKNGATPCSLMRTNTICCDRSSHRADICVMRGDIATHAASNSILLHSTKPTTLRPMEERIRPYPRKWEADIMATVAELRLRAADPNVAVARRCDVRHDAPAIVFSTGGYTGNVYHEFNDGIIPLYITSRRFQRKVVFAVLDYRNWWFTKYADVLSRLSDYPLINFSNDTRTHCFPDTVVGLRIHGDLTIDATQMGSQESIGDFRELLNEAYAPRIWSLVHDEVKMSPQPPPSSPPAISHKPKLVILSRNGSRAIENEGDLAKLAEDLGFQVEILRPERTTELAIIYKALNSSDVMVGVHGAAMTHFLFMRPGSVFVQIVPVGTDWAAETYYGAPAARMGLRYFKYKILPRESSLRREYEESDPVLMNPKSVNAKGWQATKRIYLDSQTVELDLRRFRWWLVRAYSHLASKRWGH